MGAHLLGGGRDTRHGPPVRAGYGPRVADDEDLRVTGHREVGSVHDPTGTVMGHAEPLRGRRRDHPAAQTSVRLSIRSPPATTPAGSHSGTGAARLTSTPIRSSCRSAGAEDGSVKVGSGQRRPGQLGDRDVRALGVVRSHLPGLSSAR